ncbi:MAG: hypothetical protein LBE76_07010 [Nitrososphaerota archaeon]|jgi:anthranilate phosphoribosyltransferase|nr:hypothetical protein [Nitrososphaerota archaeon]
MKTTLIDKTDNDDELLNNVFCKLSVNKSLTWQEAKLGAFRVFEALARGDQNSFALLTGFFGALTVKKPVFEEFVGAAKALEETKTVNFHFKVNRPIVTAGGTGGDTLPTINITTPAIVVAAAAGAYAVKSGSKSFSSKTGCIDVAEALGVNVHLSSRKVEECVEKIGTVVWASEDMYPWMQPLIKGGSESLLVKQLMPLLYSLRLVIATALNPFSLKRQVRGVSEPFTELTAKVLGACGYERAFVVLGYGETKQVKIDEFSTLGKNTVSELKLNGEVETFNVYPEDVGIKRGNVHEIVARDSHIENAKVIMQILAGKNIGSCRDIVLLNAASILVLSGICKDLRDGYELAKQVIESGQAIAKIEELIHFSNNNSLK